MTSPPAPDRWTIELSNAERMEARVRRGRSRHGCQCRCRR